jgi:ParB family chromosome partitioning protein
LLELALVENLQRQDLGPLEEAAAFRRLAEEFALTQEAIAGRVGRSRSAVANSLRLLSLPDEIQASVARGEITAGHARALLGLDDAVEQRAAWRRIVDGSLTVRDAEGMTRRRSRAQPRTSRRQSPDIASIEESLRASLGTRVELRKGRRGGRLVLYFFSDEELDAIIEKLS